MTSAITVSQLHKKFRLGDYHSSLRELIPAIAGKLARRMVAGELTAEEFWALRDVSFEIKQGDSVGIIGHNGAGKSTLLKHLTGVMHPTSGTVVANGRVSALIEVGAGFHAMLTGRENVFLNGVILGMSIKEIRRKFDEIVAFSGLEDFIDTPVRRYSSGMYARLGFSVAAHLDPEILLIDEVLSVGDYVFQHKGIEKMKAISDSGATVVFVSHSLKSVQDLCKRTFLMDHGKLVMDGPTAEVTQGYLDVARAKTLADTALSTTARVSGILRSGDQPTATVDAGEQVTLSGCVEFLQDCREFDVQIRVYDQAKIEATNLSLRRLGWGVGNFAAGDKVDFVIRMDAHYCAGAYEIDIIVKDLNRQRDAARLPNSLPLFVRGASGVRGMANPYPVLEQVEKRSKDAAA